MNKMTIEKGEMKQKKKKRTRKKPMSNFTFVQAKENHTTGNMFTLYCQVTKTGFWYEVVIDLDYSLNKPVARVLDNVLPPEKKHTKSV